jgi:hypothetical protein
LAEKADIIKMGRLISDTVFELDVIDKDTGKLKCLHGVHQANDKCDKSCPIHNPSNHPLKDAPQNWSRKTGMVRKCECGIWHPDFDSQKIRRRFNQELSAQIAQVSEHTDHEWQLNVWQERLAANEAGLKKANGHTCCPKRCCMGKTALHRGRNPLQRDSI